MKSMAKNHPSTSGLRFIRDNLHRVASTDTTFIELIEILASSDAGQNVLNSLSKVAEENLEIAKTLYCRLKNSNDEKLRRLCVYLLGGIGRVHPSYLIQEIETNMSSPDTISKVNYLRALQIAFANNPDINSISNRIVEFVIDCTTGGDTLLQHDAIIASLILLKLDPTSLRPPILRFVKKSEENRIFICGLFGVRSINTEDEDLELELLDICLNSDSADAVYAAFDAVAFELYESKLDKIKLQRKTLATVKRWGKCKDYLGVHHQWLLELIGTVDSDYAINFVQDWIQEEEDPRALKIYIPCILSDMFRKNRLYLIIGMEQWKDRTKKFENICILTLKECLKDMGESYTTEKAIVDKIYDFICSMARKRGFQIHQVILDLKDKYIKSFEMLEELRIEKEPLAFDVAQNNLQFIPTLVQFLGRNWFQKRIKEKDETHLLMIWLSKLQPSDGKIRDPNKHSEHEEKEAASDPVTSIELKNLEKCLKLFGRTEQGMSRIVDGWIEEEG